MTTLHATQPREAASTASFATAPSATYAVLVAVFCGLLLISNIAATKTITVVDGLPNFLGGGIFTDGGAILFPLTYIVGDVLAEVYGFHQAKRAIWVGFALGALASLTFLRLVLRRRGRDMRTRRRSCGAGVRAADRARQPGRLPGWSVSQCLRRGQDQGADEGTSSVGTAHRLNRGRGIRRHDVVLLHRLRRVFPTWGGLISYAVAGYFYKVMVEVILLPGTYAVIRTIKKREPGYAPHRPAMLPPYVRCVWS